MKYYCTGCQTIFDEDEAGRVYDDPAAGLGLMPGYITYLVCPNCGSDEYEDAAECKVCEEWFGDTDIEDDMCPGCRKEIDEQLEAVVKRLEKYTEDADLAKTLFLSRVERRYM